jgi:hypothetical protein
LQTLIRFFSWLWGILTFWRKKKPKIYFQLRYSINGVEVVGKIGETTMATISKDNEIVLSFAAYDAPVGGDLAQIDGIPVWEISDPAIADLVPAADGLTCIARPKDVIGSATITVQADADLGAGVSLITSPGWLLEVAAGRAVRLEIIPGEVRAKTA